MLGWFVVLWSLLCLLYSYVVNFDLSVVESDCVLYGYVKMIVMLGGQLLCLIMSCNNGEEAGYI